MEKSVKTDDVLVEHYAELLFQKILVVNVREKIRELYGDKAVPDVSSEPMKVSDSSSLPHLHNYVIQKMHGIELKNQAIRHHINSVKLGRGMSGEVFEGEHSFLRGNDWDIEEYAREKLTRARLRLKSAIAQHGDSLLRNYVAKDWEAAKNTQPIGDVVGVDAKALGVDEEWTLVEHISDKVMDFYKLLGPHKDIDLSREITNPFDLSGPKVTISSVMEAVLMLDAEGLLNRSIAEFERIAANTHGPYSENALLELVSPAMFVLQNERNINNYVTTITNVVKRCVKEGSVSNFKGAIEAIEAANANGFKTSEVIEKLPMGLQMEFRVQYRTFNAQLGSDKSAKRDVENDQDELGL